MLRGLCNFVGGGRRTACSTMTAHAGHVPVAAARALPPPPTTSSFGVGLSSVCVAV